MMRRAIVLVSGQIRIDRSARGPVAPHARGLRGGFVLLIGRGALAGASRLRFRLSGTGGSSVGAADAGGAARTICHSRRLTEAVTGWGA